MKPRIDRVLTLQITIRDPKDASWIWDAHASNTPIHGVTIEMIADGTFEELVKDYIDECEEF